MQKLSWKRFGRLTEKCYDTVFSLEKDAGCWLEAFELLRDTILEERKTDPTFAAEPYKADDDTDYKYDIQGWLDDCLEEMEMREMYEVVLNMCNNLLDLFAWPEYTESEIKCRKVNALNCLDRAEEAAAYCKEWFEKEPENMMAASEWVRLLTDANRFDEAQKLVDQFLPDKTQCDDDNEFMFESASELYEAMGKENEKEQIDKAIKEYEDEMIELLEKLGKEMQWDESFDGEWPFGDE